MRRTEPEPDQGIEIQHFILTRFSYRDSPACEWQGRGADPLHPQRLAHRFTVFEVACLPSVLAQTNQNFDWVVIVDKELPSACRERLKRALEGRPRTHIHQFSPGEDLRRLGWLLPYRSTAHSCSLTTNLDDDDAIPLSFVETVQTHVRSLGAGAPPLKTLGCRQTRQWDLITSPEHPLGCISPWHRTSFLPSVGFSLLCRHPEGDTSVYALSHVLADIWFEESRGAELRKLLQHRWQIGIIKASFWSQRCSRLLDDLQSFMGPRIASETEAFKQRSRDQLFHDLSDDLSGSIVVTNHVWNEQGSRLFERKSLVTPVAGAETFPNMALDFAHLRKNSAMFTKTWSVFGQILREGLEHSPRISGPRRLTLSFRRLYCFALWFLRF